MPQDETLIIGIGNSLLSDEGAGIHALYHLQSKYPDIPNLTFLDGGTLGFTLATWIEDCANLIVFDAAELHQPSGSVKTFVGSAMDEYLGSSKRSAHEVGLLDLIHIARITNHLPKNRALIGIQPKAVDWGMEPTASVRSALNQATIQAVALITHWQTAEKTKETPMQ
ncbi:MAG: HyaD/HybD family hydrogenase maturation endopeptidase [Planctomycetota bacterium]|jgi:hydrogenase maturation protease